MSVERQPQSGEIADTDADVSQSRGKKYVYIFKAVVSILFLIYLGKWINWESLWQTTLDVHKKYLIASYLVLILGEVFIAIRLQILMRPTELSLPFSRLYRIGFISKFYAIFLPAGIGQSIARWYKVTENRTGRIQFIVVSTTEKSLFVLLTLLCVGLPLLLSTDPRIEHIRSAFMPIFLILFVSLVIFFLFILTRPIHSLIEKLAMYLKGRYGKRVTKIFEHISDFDIFCGKYTELLIAAAISAVNQAMILLRIFFLFFAVGVGLPWLTIIWIGSLVFLIQSMPISFAGIGVRESAFAYILSIYGFNHEVGVLVGLLFFSQVVMNTFIGWLFEITDRGNSPALAK